MKNIIIVHPMIKYSVFGNIHKARMSVAPLILRENKDRVEEGFVNIPIYLLTFPLPLTLMV